MTVCIRRPAAAVGEQRRSGRIGDNELKIATRASDAHTVPELLYQYSGYEIAHCIGRPRNGPRDGVQAEWVGRIARRRGVTCAIGSRAPQRRIRTPIQRITIHIKWQGIVLPGHVDRQEDGCGHQKERSGIHCRREDFKLGLEVHAFPSRIGQVLDRVVSAATAPPHLVHAGRGELDRVQSQIDLYPIWILREKIP